MLHAPQFAESVFVSTQAVPRRIALHSVVPLGHMQTPALQTPPVGQRVVHVPQWVASLVRFAHTPEQFVDPAGQAAQLPIEHTSPVAQTCPQLPQLFASLCRLTQFVPQID